MNRKERHFVFIPQGTDGVLERRTDTPCRSHEAAFKAAIGQGVLSGTNPADVLIVDWNRPGPCPRPIVTSTFIKEKQMEVITLAKLKELMRKEESARANGVGC